MTRQGAVSSFGGSARHSRRASGRPAFTLVELLTVITIIGLLVALLMPALGRARAGARTAVCISRLRELGRGLSLYANEYDDVLVPGRLPKVDDENWQTFIEGGIKYRPTFLAMMGSLIGTAPFDDPQPTKLDIDIHDQPGDRQNFSSPSFVCPEASNWTDERNACYGYNYQFLGNSRLLNPDDPFSFKNWPVKFSRIRSPSKCVAVADSMGTAASFDKKVRLPYQDNAPGESESSRNPRAFGNEGFNLDPPCVDENRGEMADHDVPARTAIHERHVGWASVLWLDSHASKETLKTMGYMHEDGSNALDNDYGIDLPDTGIVLMNSEFADNSLWTPSGRNRKWLRR